MTKMAAMPIYGILDSKFFFSCTSGPIAIKLGMHHRECKPIVIYSNYDPGWTSTYLTPRSNLVGLAFIWEKVKIIYFAETIAAFDLKFNRCIVLNDLMTLHEHQRSMSLLDLGQRSLGFQK